MVKLDDDDPKKLLRCPNGCGVTADFTDLIKCGSCRKIVCRLCRRLFREKSYCKTCFKEKQREAGMGKI